MQRKGIFVRSLYIRKSPSLWDELFLGDPERTRFSAEKPRAGKQSTGLFSWTALSSPLLVHKKKPIPLG